MSKTFHHQMMRALDTAIYEGESIPARTHYAMRQALRRANMKGDPITSPRQLAKATFFELAQSQ